LTFEGRQGGDVRGRIIFDRVLGIEVGVFAVEMRGWRRTRRRGIRHFALSFQFSRFDLAAGSALAVT
jgi:hypothetical protein